jgi:hypothetical protein
MRGLLPSSRAEAECLGGGLRGLDEDRMTAVWIEEVDPEG